MKVAWAAFGAVIAFVGVARAGGRVDVSQDSVTLPWTTSQIRGKGTGAFFPEGGTIRRSGSRTFQTVVLENEYLKVRVIPEIGGAVERAIHKPTGYDIFYREMKAKDFIPYWESGVKISFPWHEHGIRMTDQPASWRVVREPDGSASVVMWMEFSRFDEPINSVQWGRFGSMMLSQRVRLRPGEATFSVTYRVVNPTPFRQGRRLWNDVFFPRNHTSDGIVNGNERPPKKCTTEWIYPANFVSGHEADKARAYDPAAESALAHYDTGKSIFAWDIKYGFAGLWYPAVQVNRLRLTDPAIAPGAKQYFAAGSDYESRGRGSHHENFVELWGGTDSIFEGVENWMGLGESYEFTHRFALTKGLGKVQFANEHAAIAVRREGAVPWLDVLTWRECRKLSLTANGKLIGEHSCGPEHIARFALKGFASADPLQIKLLADGRPIVDQQLPLSLPADTSRHDLIRKANGRDDPESLEKQGDAQCRGKNWRSAIGKYPAGSTGRGRLLYRAGRLNDAIANLWQAVEKDREDGEAWHLLGVAMLEKGDATAETALRKAIAAQRPYPSAGYYLAIIALSHQDPKAAVAHLHELLAKAPQNFEGRLLLARVACDLKLAEQLAHEDPADPRALFVLRHCADVAGQVQLARDAQAAFDAMMKEPGAAKRLADFRSAAEGKFAPPPRMK